MVIWMAIKKMVWLLLLVMLISAPVGWAEAAGLALRTDKDEVSVVMKGEAPAEAPDRQRIARKNAIQEAVRFVIGEEVRSQSMVEDFRLVYDRVFTKTKGFVKKVHTKGGPHIADGIFSQEFQIVVSTPELDKTLVRTSIEAQIDIPSLYQIIDSPRIAMVIREYVLDELGTKTAKEPDLHAESAIQAYFEKRNSDFHFTSLPFLTSSAESKPDWVALGHKNNFDIVIIGDISTKFLLRSSKKIRGVGKDIEIPMYRYSSELTWNIVNVARAERVNTIHEIFNKGDKESGSSQVAAQEFSKDKVLDTAVPRLFSELMLGWVDTVYYTPYEVIFAQTSAAEDFTIHKKLSQLSVVVSDALHSRGSIDGKLVYEMRVKGLLSEVTRELAVAFPAYEISESRHGRVVMNKAGSSAAVFMVEIEDVSFMQSDEFLQQLRALPAVHGVNEPSLRDGNAVYTVTTTMTGRSLAMQLEKVLKVRVTGLSGQSIKAKTP